MTVDKPLSPLAYGENLLKIKSGRNCTTSRFPGNRGLKDLPRMTARTMLLRRRRFVVVGSAAAAGLLLLLFLISPGSTAPRPLWKPFV